MKLTEENRTQGKTCPSASSPTTKPKWAEPGSNPTLRVESSATNRLSYGTAPASKVTKQCPYFCQVFTLRTYVYTFYKYIERCEI
jgi:hypothetical protein